MKQFKVGDKVSINRNFPSQSIKKGDLGTIVSTVNRFIYNVRLENNKFADFHPDYLEHFKEDKRKIIGYKAPIDMFEGKIKAGSIYETHETNPEKVRNKPFAYCIGNGQSTYSLPKEIVETWEPVYERPDRFSYTIADRELIVHKGGYIDVLPEGTNTTIGDIISILDRVYKPFIQKIAGWEVKITTPTVYIGCTEVKIEELQEIVDKFKTEFK